MADEITVEKLIELLKYEDPTLIVVLQKDSEGNGFSPLTGMWDGAYVEDSQYGGTAMLAELTDEDRKQGYTEEDVTDDGKLALFLCPRN